MRFRRKRAGKAETAADAGTPSGLRVSEENVDEQTHAFVLTGFEDEEMVNQFRTALRRVLEGGKTRLVVDLSGVMILGLETSKLLLGAREWVEPSGGSVVVVFPSDHPSLQTMLSTSGLDKMFPIRRTRAEALKLLAGGS